jgi:four helix bundle protein
MTRDELQERLIDFAVLVTKITREFPRDTEGKYYKDQMIRSSASPALNYGESTGAGTRKDFIHKTRIVLKELRETFVALKISHKLNLYQSHELTQKALQENNELIAIFVKTLKTSQENQNNDSKSKK